MQATKRHKTLKKEFLLRFLCLFVAEKILSACAIFPERGLPGRSAFAARRVWRKFAAFRRARSCCAQDGRAPFGCGQDKFGGLRSLKGVSPGKGSVPTIDSCLKAG